MCTRCRNRGGANAPELNTMLWLYIHFPALQLDSLPTAPNETPCPRAIVCERHFTVLQLNTEAEASGLHLGMGMALACSLNRELQVLPFQSNFGPERLREIAHLLYPLSADISIFEPDGLLLKASSMLRYHGGLTPYWQAITAHLNNEGLRHSAATGLRPLSARVVARHGDTCIEDDNHWLQHHWQILPLHAADFASRPLNDLQRLGLKSLAKLCALPRSELADRLDNTSLTYLQKLTGEKPHPVRFFTPPERFGHYRELPCEIETTDALLPPLTVTVQSLQRFLQSRAQVTDALQLTLHLRAQESIVLNIHAGGGEDSAKLWQGLIELKLESLALNAAIYAYTLSANRSFNREQKNQDLFCNQNAELTPAQLLARLQAKLGSEAIKQTLLCNDFRPGVHPGHIKPTQKLTALTPHSLRPSVLLRHPKATAEPLVLVHGPERIVTGWWDQQTLSRDYFVARNRAGRWLWVYKPLSPPDKNWYIHGYFC
ncbi:DNA polymerase Y family protein [Gilvimarinus sp. SDUM040013]|uniref:DNA polymerase Y family protein n=1 Tax=Gilvimarinus gilvus TaxID=3058038 RepID=A0ABU4RYP6_9GAMM|nr:DNA polymerase Y family protein [Gilvimarinus sp. SDUM040013]MDO3386336.1 DNA polymerase Y family protein [Gilvimarinus sp. SDUM040013]MDX6850006.1 DNA polymerase Y family protein [Gilvimarinus sp. SDUM040013]